MAQHTETTRTEKTTSAFSCWRENKRNPMALTVRVAVLTVLTVPAVVLTVLVFPLCVLTVTGGNGPVLTVAFRVERVAIFCSDGVLMVPTVVLTVLVFPLRVLTVTGGNGPVLTVVAVRILSSLRANPNSHTLADPEHDVTK